MIARRLFVLFAVAMLAITGMSVSAQEDIVIDFYYPIAVDGPLTEVVQGYADDFMAENEGIIINPVYTGSYTQTREVVLTEGMDPVVDVAVLLAIDLFTFVEEGTIVPLDDYLAQEQIDDTFDVLWQNSIDEMGSYWSVPFQRSTPVLYYNADLLAENDIAVPQNNEELLAAAQALTTEDRFGLMIPVAGTFPIWMFESFANGFGQPLSETDTPAEVFLNTEEALAAASYLVELGTVYNVMPEGGSAWGDTPTAFTSGQAAMIYHTTGSLTSILNNADFEVGVAFTPSGPAGEDGTGFGTPTGGGNLYMFDNPNAPKSEAELAATWAWIEYLSSAEIQSDWSVQSGYIAARTSAWDIEPLATRTEEFPQYAVARDQLAIADREFASFRTVDVQGIINATLSRILSGEVSLEDAAAELEAGQTQIDGLLEEYR
ncbi:MAG: extracellular solute-binding protein [Chloroflexota bacterium]